MRLRAPHAGSRGFTLLELILAMSVMAGILTSAYLCLHAGLEGQDLLESRRDAGQSARVALALLAADLRSACALGEGLDFIGMDRDIEGIEADNLDFATRNWMPRGPGEGGSCEVSWYVDRSRETGGLALWRRRDPTPDPEPLDGGEKDEIASGLAGLRFEYYDGFLWHDEWGDAGLMDRGPNTSPYATFGLPDAVRITVAFAASGETLEDARRPGAMSSSSRSLHEPLVFQTIVFLNLARWATDAPSDEGDSSSSESSSSEAQAAPEAQASRAEGG